MFVGMYVHVDKTIYVPCVNVHDDMVKNESEAYIMAQRNGMKHMCKRK